MVRTKQCDSGESLAVQTQNSVAVEAVRVGSGEAAEVEDRRAASQPQAASRPPILHATSWGRVMCPGTCGHVTVIVAPKVGYTSLSLCQVWLCDFFGDGA